MATTISAAKAKAEFAECMRKAEAGDPVVITRHGKAVVALVRADRLQQLERLRSAGPAAGLAGKWQAENASVVLTFTADTYEVSVDGKVLWLSGRFDNLVYAIDTTTGEVRSIRVGKEPHGLTVWPQPEQQALGQGQPIEPQDEVDDELGPRARAVRTHVTHALGERVPDYA